MKRLIDYGMLYEGATILHNKRYKVVRKIKKDYIETIYLKPNDKGWRRVEHLPLYEPLRPLKIGEYQNLIDKIRLTDEQIEGMIEL